MTNTNLLPSQSSSPKVVIGNETLSRDIVAGKVRQDIDFLSNRISQLEAQSNPNPNILKVYQDMLDSRHDILSWLDQSQRWSAGN
jgi:hypothetical protein